LAATFRAHGIEARVVTGGTPKKLRGETVEAFKKGEFPVLLNCGVFTEGTDIPNIDCVLLARPTKSRNLLVQMIGRGMRLHPGKANCHIIDMVSSLKTGVITTPTLYGLDPDELVDGANVEDLRTLKQQQQLRLKDLEGVEVDPDNSSSQGNNISVSFVDYDSVNDLIEDTSGERHIRAISRYAWVEVNENDFVLTTNSGNILRIINDEDGYKVKYTVKLPPMERKKVPYGRPRVIVDKAQTFENAVHGADAFAEKVFPFLFIDKNQSWRGKPATEAQLKYLNNFRDEDNQLDPDSTTKGRAVDMITKLKFGAKGRFGKIEAAQARVRKQDELTRKLEEMELREQVRVGPLQN
jgi:ATP-dependent helicase IRC3